MADQLALLMEPVARFLFGEPNAKLSSKTELRYGNRGSLSVDLAKGTYFDHESGEGGGVLDLVTRERGLTGKDRLDWLEQHGFAVEGERRINGKGQQRRLVKAYNYDDESGRLLFQVCRFENPKTFRQRQPDASQSDGWRWSTKGVRLVPYRLPEVVEQIALGHVIAIVEGEKDADLLWSLGIPATCNPGGAGKWAPDLTKYFKDADCVIVPDNDPQKKHPQTGAPLFHPDGRAVLPGQDHALDIARALDGIAAQVRMLELPKVWPDCPLKGDISDWILAGGTAEMFYALVDRLVPWSPDQVIEAPSAKQATASRYVFPDPAVIPPREWLYGAHYVRNCATATVAPGGFGKTTLTLFELISMALEGRRVWFISGEDPMDELHRRIAAHCQHHEADREAIARHLFVDDKVTFPLFLGTCPRASMVRFDDAWLERFEHEIRDKAIDVVAIDPFISFHAVPENDNGGVDQVVKRLALIAQRTNACIELSHHVRKPVQGGTGELTVDDTRGGSAIVNAVRSCRVINRMSSDEAGLAKVSSNRRTSYVRVDKGKRNMAPSETAQWWHIVSVALPNGDNVQAIERWEYPAAFAELSTETVAWVQKLLKEGGPRRASSQSPDWLGHDIGRHAGREDTHLKAGAMWANKIISTWLANKVFKQVTMRDERRKPVPGYAHNEHEGESAKVLPFKAP